MTQPVGTTAPTAPTCYRHPDRVTYVSCVRCGRPICPDCMRPASVGFQCPEEAAAPKVRTIRTSPGALGVARAAPVTATLIAANVAVFVYFVATGSQFAGEGIGVPEFHAEQISILVANGGYYRILTAMFTHYGIVHIGLNMLTLFFVGVPLERQLGRTRFAAIYLLSGIGGGVATYLLSNPLQASAGASGAIFGVFGAYFVVARRRPSAQLGSIGSTIVINLVLSFAIPGISVTDHIGGLVVGAVLGSVAGLERRILAGRRARPRALALEVAAFTAVLLVLIGVTAARTHVLRDRHYHIVGAPAVVSQLAAAPPALSPPPPA